ncbi:MAG: hypothetical protein ACYDCL_18150 [Myxococcales bacterium]
MSTNSSKQAKLQKFSAAANGCSTQFPAKTVLPLAGQSLTPAQVLAVFTAAAAAVNAVTPVRAQLQKLVASQAAALKTANSLYVALKKYVESVFGKGSPVLAAFGFSTALPRKASVLTKATAQAKAKLTRQARGTTGARQKQAVTSEGSVGLVLYGPDGKPIPGITRGPIAPGTQGNNSGTP